MNENKIAIFTNPEFGEVRTLETEDGKVLFCGKDVATALDYKDTRRNHSTLQGVGEMPPPLPTETVVAR